jgi:2-amino-4-hydroxy-6-hydroxymethyldihydropteridine diphosphokinase
MMLILGLGTNLGNREAQLRAACEALIARGIMTAPVRRSPIYESPPLLPEDAPEGWALLPYLNMAIGGMCALPPLELLAAIKHLERDLGRLPRSHWAPREMDIDILVYGNLRMETPTLTIPHAGLLMRDFAAIPLADIWPDWEIPHGGHIADYVAQRGWKLRPYTP